MILYQSIAVLVVTTLDLLRYIPRNILVCSSKDLIENLDVENATFYCQFIGMSIYVLCKKTIIYSNSCPSIAAIDHVPINLVVFIHIYA